MKLKEKLKKFNNNGIFDHHKLVNKTLKWPNVENNYGDIEKLKTDIFEFKKLKDNMLIVKCGCDWQPPYNIKIILNSDNELEIVECRLSDFGMDDYISVNDIFGN